MANKPNTPATTDATPQAPTPEAQTANGAAGGFDWSALDEPIVMPTKATPTPVVANVLETVPEQIRQRAEASLVHNTAAKAKKAESTAKRPRILYRWDFQPVKDDKMAAAFDRLLAKYAKYRPNIEGIPHAHKDSPQGQVTARTGAPGFFVRTDDGEFAPCKADTPNAIYGLRYSVRPFEQHKDTARLPGTE